MQWVLRADVERSALLEDEAKLNAVLDPVGGDATKIDKKSLPSELRGVNLSRRWVRCWTYRDHRGALQKVGLRRSYLA